MGWRLQHPCCGSSHYPAWTVLTSISKGEVCPFHQTVTTYFQYNALCMRIVHAPVPALQGSRPGQCDQSTAEVLLDKFVEVGGNFIDTADIYQYGDCEAIIGQLSNSSCPWCRNDTISGFVWVARARARALFPNNFHTCWKMCYQCAIVLLVL